MAAKEADKVIARKARTCRQIVHGERLIQVVVDKFADIVEVLESVWQDGHGLHIIMCKTTGGKAGSDLP